jgi:nicotinate-nucleotide pyrophosphorylase (carboxylating)
MIAFERSNMQLTAHELSAADGLITLALAEDLGEIGDITANATIPPEARGSAAIVSRKPGVIAGLPVAARIAERMGMRTAWQALLEDGTFVEPGTRVATITGRMRALLAFERTALNFLQHLSGIASVTRKYVDQVTGTKAVILDTRKTLPGWRLLEKYAVRAGGGQNHRIGLYDAVLIKDNHLAWLAHEADPIEKAVRYARESVQPGTIVEIEVDGFEQLDRALACGPDIILIDNFAPEELIEAVRRRDAVAPSILLESSGGITIETIRARALTGVDRISVGALTHSAIALDLGLDFEAVVP